MKILMVVLITLTAISCSPRTSTENLVQDKIVEEAEPTGTVGSTGTGVSGLLRTLQGEELMVVDGKYANDVCYIEPTPELKARLSPEEWKVLVEAGTEPPFMNKYWDNHEVGIYFDAVDGTPLFASKSKFDSGTGWPSFWEPIDKESILLVEDLSFGMRRIEVRAKASGGHLGHLFDDGPQPTGMRYCINSAALRFIPLEKLEAEGYGHLISLLQP
ncbi:MAG: peptide-methionine (R)-S-oxide reductase MsrB [Spirochaetia bacterium]|jgi:methionine-R-sulfoxide reductase|nr:peptide-methionine (R)-S-oxide reductase MsrB [Spirochaetia bacterium]